MASSRTRLAQPAPSRAASSSSSRPELVCLSYLRRAASILQRLAGKGFPRDEVSQGAEAVLRSTEEVHAGSHGGNLTREVVASPVQASIDDQARPDARPGYDADEVPGSDAGPESQLPKGGKVYVVFYEDRKPVPRHQDFPERDIPPPEKRCPDHYPFGMRRRARYTDADSSELLVFLQRYLEQLIDEPGQATHLLLGTHVLVWQADLVQHLAVEIADLTDHVGSREIHPDHQVGVGVELEQAPGAPLGRFAAIQGRNESLGHETIHDPDGRGKAHVQRPCYL